MIWLLLAACTPPEDTGDTGDTAPFECPAPAEEPAVWSLLAGDVGSGVLLSAWSDGATVRLVGGDLGGGPGVMAHYDGGSLCTEDAVTERALWWIHGATEGSWFAVGEGGTILRSVDGVRTREDVETAATLFGVYDDGTTVWAVGGDVSTGRGEAWRREDGAWTRIAHDLPGVLFKVWAGFVVGDRASYRIEGDTLVPVAVDERLLTVRGRDESDVYAVGGTTGPRILAWNGTGWDPFDSEGLYQPLNGVWTAPGRPLYVAGNFGTAAVYDGGWQAAWPPVTDEHLHAAWGHCDETLFAGGNLFDAGDNHGTIVRWGPPIDPVEVGDCP